MNLTARHAAANLSATRLRAFLAIRLSAAVEERVIALKHQLEETGAAVRWTRDESLHVTLKFLGSVAPDGLDRLREALAQSLVNLTPFTARVIGLGIFPRPDRPRIVWVGIEATELKDLAAAVETAASKVGFAPEERPFRGHLSLGRVKDRRGWSRVAAILKERGEEDFGSFEVRQVAAFRSDLQRGGSVYTEIWTIPLLTSIRGGDHGIGRESRASAGPGRQSD